MSLLWTRGHLSLWLVVLSTSAVASKHVYVSGLVCRLLARDCCVSRVCLKMTDDVRGFEDVVSLMYGRKILITPTNVSFLAECAHELENHELLDGILCSYLNDDISMSNVLERIGIKSRYHSDDQCEFDFLAKHFCELDLDILRHLSISKLELVLTSPLLSLESEDQLYDVIHSLARMNGDDYFVLLRHVNLTIVNDLNRVDFLNIVFPDMVDMAVWESLCSMILHSSKPSMKKLMNSTRYSLKSSHLTKGRSWGFATTSETSMAAIRTTRGSSASLERVIGTSLGN